MPHFTYTYYLLTRQMQEERIEITAFVDRAKVRQIGFCCSINALIEVNDMEQFKLHLHDVSKETYRCWCLHENNKLIRQALSRQYKIGPVARVAIGLLLSFILTLIK